MRSHCSFVSRAPCYSLLDDETMTYHIVEKTNPHALHAICETLERAEHWINVKAPEYCAKGYFMDKTLTPDSFTIKPAKP